MDFINEFAAGLSGRVWGWPEVFPALVGLLLVTGLIMTTTLRFIQIRKLKHSLDVIRGKYDDPEHDGREGGVDRRDPSVGEQGHENRAGTQRHEVDVAAHVAERSDQILRHHAGEPDAPPKPSSFRSQR